MSIVRALNTEPCEDILGFISMRVLLLIHFSEQLGGVSRTVTNSHVYFVIELLCND